MINKRNCFRAKKQINCWPPSQNKSIEKWGKGIKLILSKEPKTSFKELGQHFISTFERKADVTPQETTQETAQSILLLIKEKPIITRKELAQKIGLSEEGIKYHLNKLRKNKTIKHVGSTKKGHWEVMEWTKKYKLKPIIEGDFDFYKITFPLDKSSSTTNTITNTITKTITKGEGKEQQIFEIVENNPYLSTEQISKIVSLSKIGVRYHLKNLKKKSRIKRKGHGKGGSWEILK